MSKGVSPLVASVLLIAATMSIAGILAFWASNFARTQTAAFENQTIASECNFATFDVYTCSYDLANKKVLLSLNNNGQVNLKDLVAYFQYPNGNLTAFNITDPLPQNVLKQFYISGVTENYSKIIIRTQCSQLSRETACK
ncbi:MAG: archaellin/type IV pilin N-terminal domain-containing protein [Candidatus Aenigmatarchaeota archaeon]